MTADERAFARIRLESIDISDQVWSVDVEDVDRGSDKATLVMDDPDSTNSDALREGAFVAIELGWESERAAVFEGCVRSVEPAAGNGHRVTVVAHDLSTRLQAARRDPSRQHTGTLESILTTILAPTGIPVGSITVDPMPSWTEEEPLRQRDRTDWELIQDLAEEYRARAFVEVNRAESDTAAVRARGGTSRFYFVSESALLAQDPMGKLIFCPGHGRLLEFEYRRAGSGASPSASTAVADPDSGAPVTHAGPAAATEPPATASAERASRAGAVIGESRARAYEAGVEVTSAAPVQPDQLRATDTVTGLPSDPRRAQRRIQQDRTRILGFSGDGVAMGTVFLRAKGAVEIEGLATWAAGNWYVSRVNHMVQRTRVQDRTQLTYRTKFKATR